MFRCVPLSPRHDRESFACGVPELDIYLRTQAGQDNKRGFASVFAALNSDEADTSVRGYYTLSAAGIPLRDIPDELRRRMPRYPSVPAVRLGRLAVSLDHQGQGLGEYLLVDALRRSLSSAVAWALFLVDAKDEGARSFYLHFGFTPFPQERLHLYLRWKDVEKL